MSQKIRREIFRISGMTCRNCAKRIQNKLAAARGVEQAEASYERGTAAIVFDENSSSAEELAGAIESLGYKVTRGDSPSGAGRNSLITVLLLIAALYMLVSRNGGNPGGIFNFFPRAETGMGYWMLFITGVLTSVHCIAMCGGINLSQCLGTNANAKGTPLPGFSSMRPALLYNAGRVASYTLAGGIVGALGSVVSMPGVMKGAIQIAAGVFMMLIGLNMLGMFGVLRALTPRMPQSAALWLEKRKRGKGPLIVGFLNGLMPCGPLQAMQLYAMGTGSPIKGALAMLAFSLGTVPLMFALGIFSSVMSEKFAGRAMKAGAALVIIMGVIMLNNGTTLSGFGSAPLTNALSAPDGTRISGNAQEVTSELPRRGYPSITVEAGRPVRWNLHAENGRINGCNNALVIPEYKIEKRLETGDNIIEFTPVRAGTFQYSCWMGMIRGTITVTENGAKTENSASPGAAEAAETETRGSSCCR